MANTIYFENGVKYELTKDEMTVLKNAILDFNECLTPMGSSEERVAEYMAAAERLQTLFLEHVAKRTGERKVVDLDTAVVRESMETYILFAEKRSVIGNAKADFYVGAAAALNDLMCRIGHGDIVDDLAARIPKGE